jgi:hypothetical protein
LDQSAKETNATGGRLIFRGGYAYPAACAVLGCRALSLRGKKSHLFQKLSRNRTRSVPFSGSRYFDLRRLSMPKRFQRSDGPPFPVDRPLGWSIDSNGLTTAGQSDILRQLGRQLQTDYQSLLKEPAPERIKNLLKRLEERGDPQDEEDM